MNRITPALPAEAFQTYQIAAPLSSHWRPASCAEVACPTAENGWRTVIDETTELGQRQAYYIRRESGRSFREYRDGEHGATVFEFTGGQECFAAHKIRVERPELYIVTGGDWRGNPAGVAPRVHTKPEHWVEDFAENQQRIADAHERG